MSYETPRQAPNADDRERDEGPRAPRPLPRGAALSVLWLDDDAEAPAKGDAAGGSLSASS